MSIKAGGENGAVPLEEIARALEPFCKGLSDRQLQSIQSYISLLQKWNKSINLTAIEDIDEILVRHFGEILFAASFLKLDESRLADVGTGPGFPGIPLRILLPKMKLTLFEANSKKCAFLTEVSRLLALSDVKIMRQRYEAFQVQTFSVETGFDFVCSRALGDYPVFLPWARSILKPGGSVVLWVGTDESISIGRRREFSWSAPVPVPDSRRRVILVGRNAGGPECFT